MRMKELIYVVEDDPVTCRWIKDLLQSVALDAETFYSGREFLAGFQPPAAIACIVDLRLPDFNGVALMEEIHRRTAKTPVILMSAFFDVGTAVAAVRQGAWEVLEKPVRAQQLLDVVQAAVQWCRGRTEEAREQDTAAARLALLTPREKEVLRELLAGRSNREMAEAFGISVRTVEVHRARLMRKLRAHSPGDVFRTTLLAGGIRMEQGL